MPLSMPERPHLDSFRRQARALQRAVRAGEPDAVERVARCLPRVVDEAGGFRLSAAQFVIAREYGFGSWPRLGRYLVTAAEHACDTRAGAVPATDPADEFCRLACLTYSRADGPERWAGAQRLLAERPDLTSSNIWAAAASARPEDVGRLLGEQPGLVAERGGPFRWRPLFHLAYSRFDPAVPAERVLAVARQLLDAGADPNDGYLFDGLPQPFTVLTGVFGHGELGSRRQPPHPRWQALGRLLLEAGADPNDAQALYNRMFEPDDSHWELLFDHGLGTGDGGPWRARIAELDPPARLLRVRLRWAIEHHQSARVRLLVEHGVDFHSPFEDDGPAWSPANGRTPVELAQLNGDRETADHLVTRGATPPGPDPVRDLIAAAFRADRSALDRVRSEHPDAVAEARRSRPGLIVWAAARAGAETVALLAELGFDVNAYGRGDAPVEEAWETALHHSAMAGDVELTRRLLDLGADPDLRDRRFDATPLDWARHVHRTATADLLEPLTTTTDPVRD
ncbi:ankyrin repeat domain-containing protein [Actinosynnema sp. NPDC091369]